MNEAITIIPFGFVSAVILLTCYIQSVLLLAADGALDDWCLEAVQVASRLQVLVFMQALPGRVMQAFISYV